MDEVSGKVFERVDLRKARFRDVDLRDAQFRGVALSASVLRGVELRHVRIDGDIEDLVINGVDVAPLVTAGLDRR